MKNKKLPISVFMITLNEEDRVGASISAIRDIVDEIIVVDSGSTDNTIKICKDLGAKVSHRNWTGYGEQKKHAESLCKNDWVMNLDADEVATKEFCDELVNLYKKNNNSFPYNVYRVKITNIYPLASKPRIAAYCFNNIRFYNKNFATFKTSEVHDSVILNSNSTTVGQIKNIVLHYGLKDISHMVEKANLYTDKQVNELARKKTLLKLKIRMLFEFPVAFIRCYLFRKEFLGGYWGFIVSMNHAYRHFIRLAKFYEWHLKQRK